MSLGSKKKDKDKGDTGGEASANYIIGEGRSTNTTSAQGQRSATAADKLSTREDISTTQRMTSSSSPSSQDQVSTDPMAANTNASSSRTTSTSGETPYQYQYQQNYQQQRDDQQSGINRALDETRDSIRKSIDEARSQIPRYTQTTNDYQEQTIQTAKEIADNFLESQKEIINSFQSAWVPVIERAYGIFWNYWLSPRRVTDMYARTVSNIADNTVATTRLVNNAVFSNLDAFKTCVQNTRDNLKEVSRIGVNAAKTFEQTSRDTATAARPVGF
ncbi:MAG TPA: hypothetical protein VE593_01675 [Nitrososphaeraceae archaeon]|nr:hypothetical protein [Nitrososphaeraceae archaeon]